MPKQTIVTPAFVRSTHNTSVSNLCWRRQQLRYRPESVLWWPHKSCCNCCLVWQI